MSRIARKPLTIPAGVDVKLQQDGQVSVKGKKGEFKYQLDPAVLLEVEANVVYVKPAKKQGSKTLSEKGRSAKARRAMVGTTCKMLSNFVIGASEGFERKLSLVGVGYRAKIQGKMLELSLGYSNPVLFEIPKGIQIEVPSNTEIFVKGTDIQLVGETAAKIRGFRSPEPYKGKGVRYADEVVAIKETKKK
jgi:large subunit ribosomal protein L6